MNARSRVHEYGGGQSVPVGDNGDTITSDFTTNTLVYTSFTSECSTRDKVLTDGSRPFRYADMVLDPVDSTTRGNNSRLLFAIREDHTIDVPANVVNSVVALSIDDHTEVFLLLHDAEI